MTYAIPGKTFLIGEYSALVEGSILGLATAPGFKVQYSNSTIFQFPFSSNSPAGVLWKRSLQNSFQFTDEIKAGGFGKSTAEYLSVLIPALESRKSNASLEVYFSEIRKNYVTDSGVSGARVSGLDLAVACFGSVTHFDSKANKYKSAGWNFPNLEFFLIETGIKVKTHEHIQTLDLNKINHFPSVSNPLVDLYFKNNGVDFVRGLNEWTKFLISENLVHTHSIDLRTKLLSNADVLSAKPCGAMGADVMLVLCHSEKAPAVKHKISELGLSVKATSKDLAAGIFEQLPNNQRGLHVG